MKKYLLSLVVLGISLFAFSRPVFAGNDSYDHEQHDYSWDWESKYDNYDNNDYSDNYHSNYTSNSDHYYWENDNSDYHEEDYEHSDYDQKDRNYSDNEYSYHPEGKHDYQNDNYKDLDHSDYFSGWSIEDLFLMFWSWCQTNIQGWIY